METLTRARCTEPVASSTASASDSTSKSLMAGPAPAAPLVAADVLGPAAEPGCVDGVDRSELVLGADGLRGIATDLRTPSMRLILSFDTTTSILSRLSAGVSASAVGPTHAAVLEREH